MNQGDGWVESPEKIKKILHSFRTVAVVGLSDKPERASYGVAAYLKQHGYNIIPVNPNIQSFMGEQAYPDLLSIPGSVEIVDIFRRAEDVPAIVEQAIAKGAKVIWMQEGIEHHAAAERAQKAGLRVIMNKCLLKEHMRWLK